MRRVPAPLNNRVAWTSPGALASHVEVLPIGFPTGEHSGTQSTPCLPPQPGGSPDDYRQEQPLELNWEEIRYEPLRPVGHASVLAEAVAGAPGCLRGVMDRVPEAFIEVVDGDRVGVVDERPTGGRETPVIAYDARQPDFIDPAAIRRISRAGIMLLGTHYKIRVVGVGSRPPVPITDISGRPLDFCVQVSVDIDPHPTIRGPPCQGNVVPQPVGDLAHAAQSGRVGSIIHPESDAAVGHRDAEVAVVAAPVDISVEEGIAVDPVVSPIDARPTPVLRRQGLHPPLEGEITGPDIGRARRVVDRDLNPIDSPVPVAVESEVEPGGRQRSDIR